MYAHLRVILDNCTLDAVEGYIKFWKKKSTGEKNQVKHVKQAARLAQNKIQKDSFDFSLPKHFLSM